MKITSRNKMNEKMDESLKESYGQEEYEFDTSSLSGEEMLTLDELLSDMMAWADEDSEDVEELFERCYNRYRDSHKDYKVENSSSYDDDKAWMFAEGRVLDYEINSLSDDTIKYYLQEKTLSDEQQAVLDKCMSVKQPERTQHYRVCDTYDFGPWTKYDESLNEDNLNPVMRKDAKIQYKRHQGWRDRKKSDYDELLNFEKEYIKSGKKAFDGSQSTSDDIKAYKSLKDRYKKRMDDWDEEHPFKLYKERGLEREDYPYYVTLYNKNATYEPAEGGYYVEERYASSSQGFNTYEEAVADMNSYIEESAEDWKPLYKDCYGWSTRYIGEGQIIRIETNKNYLEGEKHYSGYESFNKDKYKSRKKPVKMNESNNEDMGYKLGKWLGARLLTGWTAMLNVDGAEESPYYDEYDQLFDGTFVQCLNKLKEYQDIIDRDGVPAYLALQSSHDEYFDGDYDTIIDKLYDMGYLYDNDLEDNDIDESINENCNSYSYKGKTIIDAGDYWFVKGFKEKFPTSDEAEEFIDDKKKDENYRVNIRESLNKMDAESDNTYDLLNLYESKNLSKSQKKDIARMIYENYGLEKIYNYLYEATEEEDELPVEDRIKELTNNFKNTNGSYVFEDTQDANKAISILKSRGYEASQKRTQDNKYRVTAQKKDNNK